MAEISSDCIKDGIRTIIFEPYESYTNTTDRGCIGFSVVLVATNDKVNTSYSFSLCLNTTGNKFLNISNGKRLLFTDEKKNMCVLNSGYCPINHYKRLQDYTNANSYSYVIENDKIESLTSLSDFVAIRIETETSFIEGESLTYLHQYLRECIAISKKAIKNTSDTFLKPQDIPIF